jgi:hypothetical protein
MPQPLAPNEHLSGTPGQRAALLARLTAIRARPDPRGAHPQLTFTTLADLTTTPPPWLDLPVLQAGIALARLRYRSLGLTRLLPPERTRIGTASADPDAFGGFHYPGQGYRHWQMRELAGSPSMLWPPCPL